MQAELNQHQLLLQGIASPAGDLPKTQVSHLAPLLTPQVDLKTFEGVRVADRMNEAKPTKEAMARARTFRRRQTLEDVALDTE
jgi:hypothetical protein